MSAANSKLDTPLLYADRTIGSVDTVAANRIIVRLTFEAPSATTLAGGWPSSFPRINGYLLIPTEAGATIGMITEVTIERAALPRGLGPAAMGLIDLPAPSRLLSLVPIGTLVEAEGSTTESVSFRVRRGVDVFPSVGDSVLLPTKMQLRAMVEGEGPSQSNSSGAAAAGRVLLGSCPTAAAASVYFDPDKIFGRHLAILGNTGSGKSCSVAGIIRWSLEEATKAREQYLPEPTLQPNARFIILDPNGEYGKAFKDFELQGKVRRFAIGPTEGVAQLKVPAWLWNAEEWAAFTAAAPGVQRPLLYEALRQIKAGSQAQELTGDPLGLFQLYFKQLKERIQSEEYLTDNNPGCNHFGQFLTTLRSGLSDQLQRVQGAQAELLKSVIKSLTTLEENHRQGEKTKGQPKPGYWYRPFDVASTLALRDKFLELLCNMKQEQTQRTGPDFGEDAPRYFDVRSLAPLIEKLARDRQSRDANVFVDTLRLRIETMLGSPTLASIVDADSNSLSLDKWLEEYIGSNQAENGPLSIIDLSLVPSEIVHIVVAVLARMILEATQRYRRESAKDQPGELPTVLVLDEAHTFIHRELLKESSSPAGSMCCRTFEKIAREGRKFGLGLVLASQRPSEVSPTVLSQCNTFLLHRLVNDLDQQLVRNLVPDGLSDMLRELPSLPSRRAILLGWGAPAPILVEIREIRENQRPWSPDPPFWAVWTGQRPANIDWGKIATSWGGPPKLPEMTEYPEPKSPAMSQNVVPITEEEIPF